MNYPQRTHFCVSSVYFGIQTDPRQQSFSANDQFTLFNISRRVISHHVLLHTHHRKAAASGARDLKTWLSFVAEEASKLSGRLELICITCITHLSFSALRRFDSGHRD